jgi:hypothetical protein
MRKFIIILSLVVLSGNLFAQSSDRKGFIGISLGPSFPVGNFADNTLSNADAGFVEWGINFNPINFGYIFGQYVGISASWFGAAYSADINGVDAIWSYGGLMGGPMLSIPVNEKFDLDLKGMVGFVTATSDLSEYEENEGTGISFDLGASFRYNFAKKWCLLISSDYFISNPKLEDGNQKMTAISLSLGIAYRLK